MQTQTGSAEPSCEERKEAFPDRINRLARRVRIAFGRVTREVNGNE